MHHSVEPQGAVLETQSMHCTKRIFFCPWLVQIETHFGIKHCPWPAVSSCYCLTETRASPTMLKRVSTSPRIQSKASAVSLYSLSTRLEAKVARRCEKNSSVAFRCASLDRASGPSTT